MLTLFLLFLLRDSNLDAHSGRERGSGSCGKRHHKVGFEDETEVGFLFRLINGEHANLNGREI